jgi:hypothetical protein
MFRTANIVIVHVGEQKMIYSNGAYMRVREVQKKIIGVHLLVERFRRGKDLLQPGSYVSQFVVPNIVG